MNNVDLILRYLSGEMDPEEISSFERKLDDDEMLHEEFRQISKAYALVKQELQNRDREEFRNLVKEVIDEHNRKDRAGSPRRKRLYLLTSLAASLAIVLFLLLPDRTDETIYSRFYAPEEDKVLLALGQDTRGGIQPGIRHYRDGSYAACRSRMYSILEKDPRNQVAMLYFLLASLETDMESQALDSLVISSIDMEHQPGQSLAWYTSMALLKSDREEDARMILNVLSGYRGPYRKRARKVLELLSK
jgi:hypothetical protein